MEDTLTFSHRVTLAVVVVGGILWSMYVSIRIIPVTYNLRAEWIQEVQDQNQ